MPATSHPDFLEVFQSRRDLFRALVQLSRQQRDLVAADDYTRLLGILGQKQRVLGRLDILTRQVPDLRAHWRKQRNALDDSRRAACDQALAEAERLLAELLDEERRSTECLTHRRDETQRQLQEISAGAQIHQAYRDDLTQATHRQLDIGQ